MIAMEKIRICVDSFNWVEWYICGQHNGLQAVNDNAEPAI